MTNTHEPSAPSTKPAAPVITRDDKIVRAAGHTDPKVYNTRRGFRFACACGYESQTRATQAAALEAAVLHLSRVRDTVVRHARQNGITLAAAAEFERVRVSNSANAERL